MDDHAYDLRVYAEGVRIPVYGVTQTQRLGQPQAFRVNLPATPKAFSVLPNTTIHVFLRRSAPGEEERWVLFAEGRVKSRTLRSDADRMQTTLRCKGISGDWGDVKMGFNVGSKRGIPEKRKAHFFYGFSTGEEDGVPFEGFKAGQAGKIAGALSGKPGSRFLGFRHSLQQMVEQGPVNAALAILSAMPAFSPLFRQYYNALGIQERIGAAQNDRMIKWMEQRGIKRLMGRRLRGLSSDTSLLELVQKILQDSRHEMTVLPSPYFDAEAKKEEKELEALSDKEFGGGLKGAQGRPAQMQDRDTLGTSPDDDVDELLQDPRIQAYLDVIARSEMPESLSKSEEYRALYGAGAAEGRIMGKPELHQGHPRQSFSGPSGPTTAAGRYQFQEDTWDNLASRYSKVKEGNFSPKMQDRAAVYLLREQSAIRPILEGDMLEANDRVSNIWASIPTKDGTGFHDAQDEVPHSHADITRYQNSQIEAHMADQGGSVPGAYFKGEELRAARPLARVMPTHIIKPQLRDAPAPMCNVIMPSDIEDFSASENFEGAPTRLMMMRQRGLNPGQGKGAAAEEIEMTKAFAPRSIAVLIRALDDGGSFFDLKSTRERRRIQKETPPPFKDFLSPMPIKIPEEQKEERQKRRVQKKINEEQSKVDLIRSVLDNRTELPDNLLGLYTLEELMKGLFPATGYFPYPELGDESPGGKIEAEIKKKLQDNEDVIIDITPLSEDEYYNKSPVSKDLDKKVDRAAKNITANTIFANHRLKMMRRQSRSASYTGRLNPDLALGFPAAVHHPALGWMQGTVLQVQHSIDVQRQTAQTRAKFGFCRFFTDMDNPIWKQMIMTGARGSSEIGQGGMARNPVFYDDDFAPDNVGDKLYQKLLGMPSVYDVGSDAEEERTGGMADLPSARSVLQAIYQSYDEAENKRAWRRRHVRRPIATEKNVFEDVMNADPDGKDYASPYQVFEIATEEDAFMEERAEWAREYRASLEESDYNIDATFADPENLQGEDQ